MKEKEREGEGEREKERISSSEEERDMSSGSEAACSGVAERLTDQLPFHESEAIGVGGQLDRDLGPESDQEERTEVGEEERDSTGVLDVTLALDPGWEKEEGGVALDTGWGREEGGLAGSLTEPVSHTSVSSTTLLSLTTPPGISGNTATHHGSHDVVPDHSGAAGHVISHSQSCDRPDVCGRSHRRSRSWSGVSDVMVRVGGGHTCRCVAVYDVSQIADTVPAGEEHENVFPNDEGAWSSGSHTPSHVSKALSLDHLFPKSSTEHSQGVTLSGVSPWQQGSSMHGSLELHSGDFLSSEKGEGMEEGMADGMVEGMEEREGEREEEGEREREREREGERDIRIRRNMSLPLANPSHIAMVTLLDRDSDDVIAVPVRSSAATTR